MSMITFSTNHLREVFSEEGKYEGFKKLVSDLVRGNELFDFDENGNKIAISKKEANAAVRKVLLEVCELTEADLKSPKRRARALERHHDELFEILEEEIEFKVSTGLHETEWFNDLVESRNINLGDAEEFYSETNGYLVVAEMALGHHDLTLQHLKSGEIIRPKLSRYGIRVGKDIDMILLNRIDFTKLCDKCAEAFIKKIQETIFAAVGKMADSLPAAHKAQFVKTGTITAGMKNTFDTLLEDVATANESDVIILGTKVALKQLNVLADVQWASNGLKDNMSNMGYLGSYEGTRMIEIPQRFETNDVSKKLMSNSVIWVFPTTEDRLVKYLEQGELFILEKGQEKGDYADDFKTYEMQRSMGVAVVAGRYFGQWDTSK